MDAVLVFFICEAASNKIINHEDIAVRILIYSNKIAYIIKSRYSISIDSHCLSRPSLHSRYLITMS